MILGFKTKNAGSAYSRHFFESSLAYAGISGNDHP